MIRAARTKVRRWRYTLVTVGTFITLAVRTVSGRDVELWIGDSHAMCLNEPRSPARLTKATQGQFVAYLGPKLMFSIARDGFPAWVDRLVRTMALMRRSGRVTLLFCTGEIDLRCHLVPQALLGQGDPLAFIQPYVHRCRDVALDARAARWFVVTPPPPSATVPDQRAFPVRGEIGERIQMRVAMVDRLMGIAPEVIDIGPALQESSGALAPRLTDDDCHTNALGVALTRTVVTQRFSRA